MYVRRRLTLLARLAVVGLAACGSGPSTVPGVDASTPAAFDDGVAHVEVRSRGVVGSGDTTISALLVTTPAPWPYMPPLVDGVCRMWRREPTTACQPSCTGDQICVGGACRPWPVSDSAGTLTVAGGGARTEVAYDLGYQHYDPRVVFPPDTELTASAPGSDLPGFALAARMPSPLTLLGTDTLVLAVGTPLALHWTPADADPDVRVRVVLGADLGHGRHRSVVVECDVADADGGVALPQTMVDELADPANWSCGDCFGHEVRRYHRADTTLGGVTLTLWAVQLADLYLRP